MSELDRMQGWRLNGDNWGQSLSANTYPREEARMTAYTADQYQFLADIIDARETTQVHENIAPIVSAALKVAARVTKRGVIEAAVGNNRITAERIRKAVGADNG